MQAVSAPEVEQMTEIHSHIEALMFAEERPTPFTEGTVIFEEGETGESMYIVRTGKVTLWTNDRLLETVGPSGLVGEMALIDNSPRCARAVAGADCTVVVITREEFDELVRQVPGFAREVMGLMAQRLRRSNVLAKM
jgi:CRP/FNR family cyclic AMP-dependent transcriptional regulator